MLEFLFCLVILTLGMAIGSVLTQIVSRRKTAYGYFVLNPVEDPEDPGTYTVGIKFTGNIVPETKKVILYKGKDSVF